MKQLEELIDFFWILNKDDVISEWNEQQAWKKESPDEFKEWHGTSSIAIATKETLMRNCENAKVVQAKIASGELEEYPFEDRRTSDGYVDVDNLHYDAINKRWICELDNYHSLFLKIDTDKIRVLEF